MNEKQMVTAVFRDRTNAEMAFDFLRLRGYGNTEINVLMSDKTRSSLMRVVENEEKHEAGSLAAETTATGRRGSFRLDPHRMRDFFGSMSRTKTSSPASFAATGS